MQWKNCAVADNWVALLFFISRGGHILEVRSIGTCNVTFGLSQEGMLCVSMFLKVFFIAVAKST